MKIIQSSLTALLLAHKTERRPSLSCSTTRRREILSFATEVHMYEGYDTSECMLCDLFHNSTTAAADYNGCVRVQTYKIK
mmetsp:Transcript_22019/g.31562  ORF Transcript_22019/g.31562 Transcript_22019/m.31562 type:complete len:80 (-) Transcript_22019:3-242(-)